MNDRDAMERAYEVARSARANGNHPFGAVLVLWTARLLPRPKTQCHTCQQLNCIDCSW